MSREQVVKLNFLFTWLTRATVVTLASVTVYFVQGIHADIKQDHKTVESHELRISLIEAKIK